MSCCCSGTNNERRPATEFCAECGGKGRVVERRTLDHLLRASVQRSLGAGPYYFCATPTCEVVYFSSSDSAVLRKDELRVRVGLKETRDPIPVCYCFNHTRASIWEEIGRTGGSTVVDSIKRAVQAGQCECVIRNPSGKCCLGEVTRAVQMGIERSREPRLAVD